MFTVPVAADVFHPAFAPADDDAPVGLWSSTACPEPTDDDLEAAAAELRIADAEAELAGRCWSCGAESAGMDLTGGHVQQCDRCLTAEVVGRVGLGLVREVARIAG